MTFFHFVNCALLAFGPHVVYYKATPLSEYGTWAASGKAAAVYVFTMLVKMLLWASLLRVPEDDDFLGSTAAQSRPTWHAASSSETPAFDLNQELMKAAIGLVDLVGLFFALTRVTYRNISFSHKFQAVGLGWAAAQSLTQRLAPLWFGAGGMQFHWDYVLDALSSNSELILGISLAALGSLLWVRKNRPASLVPVLYALAASIVTLPFFLNFLQYRQHWQLQQIVAAELVFATSAAVLTWHLFQYSLQK